MRLFPRRKYESGTRWSLWRWTDVRPCDDEIYLTRLHLVQTPWFSVMLHWILRADPQPDQHDHPVAFLSIPIWGWYEEEVPCNGGCGPNLARVVRAWNFWNLKLATDCHRIVAVGPNTLTLVLTITAVKLMKTSPINA
jgi:hypothetical protein